MAGAAAAATTVQQQQQQPQPQQRHNAQQQQSTPAAATPRPAACLASHPTAPGPKDAAAAHNTTTATTTTAAAKSNQSHQNAAAENNSRPLLPPASDIDCLKRIAQYREEALLLMRSGNAKHALHLYHTIAHAFPQLRHVHYHVATALLATRQPQAALLKLDLQATHYVQELNLPQQLITHIILQDKQAAIANADGSAPTFTRQRRRRASVASMTELKIPHSIANANAHNDHDGRDPKHTLIPFVPLQDRIPLLVILFEKMLCYSLLSNVRMVASCKARIHRLMGIGDVAMWTSVWITAADRYFAAGRLSLSLSSLEFAESQLVAANSEQHQQQPQPRRAEDLRVALRRALVLRLLGSFREAQELCIRILERKGTSMTLHTYSSSLTEQDVTPLHFKMWVTMGAIFCVIHFQPIVTRAVAKWRAVCARAGSMIDKNSDAGTNSRRSSTSIANDGDYEQGGKKEHSDDVSDQFHDAISHLDATVRLAGADEAALKAAAHLWKGNLLLARGSESLPAAISSFHDLATMAAASDAQRTAMHGRLQRKSNGAAAAAAAARKGHSGRGGHAATELDEEDCSTLVQDDILCKSNVYGVLPAFSMTDLKRWMAADSTTDAMRVRCATHLFTRKTFFLLRSFYADLLLRYGPDARVLWYRANCSKVLGHFEEYARDLERIHALDSMFIIRYLAAPPASDVCDTNVFAWVQVPMVRIVGAPFVPESTPAELRPEVLSRFAAYFEIILSYSDESSEELRHNSAPQQATGDKRGRRLRQQVRSKAGTSGARAKWGPQSDSGAKSEGANEDDEELSPRLDAFERLLALARYGHLQRQMGIIDGAMATFEGVLNSKHCVRASSATIVSFIGIAMCHLDSFNVEAAREACARALIILKSIPVVDTDEYYSCRARGDALVVETGVRDNDMKSGENGGDPIRMSVLQEPVPTLRSMRERFQLAIDHTRHLAKLVGHCNALNMRVGALPPASTRASGQKSGSGAGTSEGEDIALNRGLLHNWTLCRFASSLIALEAHAMQLEGRPTVAHVFLSAAALLDSQNPSVHMALFFHHLRCSSVARILDWLQRVCFSNPIALCGVPSMRMPLVLYPVAHGRLAMVPVDVTAGVFFSANVLRLPLSESVKSLQKSQHDVRVRARLLKRVAEASSADGSGGGGDGKSGTDIEESDLQSVAEGALLRRSHEDLRWSVAKRGAARTDVVFGVTPTSLDMLAACDSFCAGCHPLRDLLSSSNRTELMNAYTKQATLQPPSKRRFVPSRECMLPVASSERRADYLKAKHLKRTAGAWYTEALKALAFQDLEGALLCFARSHDTQQSFCAALNNILVLIGVGQQQSRVRSNNNEAELVGRAHTAETVTLILGNKQRIRTAWNMVVRARQWDSTFAMDELAFADLSYASAIGPISDMFWHRALLARRCHNLQLARELLGRAIELSRADRANTNTGSAAYDVIRRKLQVFLLVRSVTNYSTEDYNAVFEDATEVVNMNPKSAFAFHMRSLAETRLGHYDNAIADLELHDTLQAWDLSALLRLANLYAFTGEFDKARTTFDRLLSKAPDAPDVLYSYALYCIRDKRWKEAQKRLLACIHSQQTYWKAHFMLALVHEWVGDYASSVAILRRLILEQPRYPGAHRCLGRAHMLQAQQLYAVISNKDNNADTKAVGKIEVDDEAKAAVFHGGRRRRIAVEMGEILRSHMLESAHRGGYSSSSGGETSDDNEGEYVSDLLPGSRRVLRSMDGVRSRLGYAYNALAAAASVDVNDSCALYMLAVSMFFLAGNRYDNANSIDRVLSRVLLLAPKDSDGNLLAGILAERRGDESKAYSYFQAALLADANNILALQARARIHFLRGDLQRAETGITRVLVSSGELSSSRNADLYAFRGLVRMAKIDHKSALVDLDNAVQLDSKHILAKLYRAECHYKLALTAESISDYRSILSTVLRGVEMAFADLQTLRQWCHDSEKLSHSASEDQSRDVNAVGPALGHRRLRSRMASPRRESLAVLAGSQPMSTEVGRKRRDRKSSRGNHRRVSSTTMNAMSIAALCEAHSLAERRYMGATPFVSQHPSLPCPLVVQPPNSSDAAPAEAGRQFPPLIGEGKNFHIAVHKPTIFFATLSGLTFADYSSMCNILGTLLLSSPITLTGSTRGAKYDEIADHHSSESLLKAKRSRQDEAMTCFHCVMDNAVAQQYIGLIFMDRNDYEKALPEFERALSLQPAYEDARVNCAVTLEKVGRLADALDMLTQLVAENGRNRVALFNLGNVQLKMRLYRDATVTYSALLRLLEGDDDIMAAVKRGAGSVAQRCAPQRDYIGAVAKCQADREAELASLADLYACARNNRAVCDAFQHDADTSAVNLSQVLSMDRHHVVARFNRIHMFLRKGRVYDAIEDLHTVVRQVEADVGVGRRGQFSRLPLANLIDLRSSSLIMPSSLNLVYLNDLQRYCERCEWGLAVVCDGVLRGLQCLPVANSQKKDIMTPSFPARAIFNPFFLAFPDSNEFHRLESLLNALRVESRKGQDSVGYAVAKLHDSTDGTASSSSFVSTNFLTSMRKALREQVLGRYDEVEKALAAASFCLPIGPLGSGWSANAGAARNLREVIACWRARLHVWHDRFDDALEALYSGISVMDPSDSVERDMCSAADDEWTKERHTLGQRFCIPGAGSRDSLLFNYAGCILIYGKQFDGAFDMFARAIRADASNIWASINRAHMFRIKGRFRSALDDYDRAVRAIQAVYGSMRPANGGLVAPQRSICDTIKSYIRAIRGTPQTTWKDIHIIQGSLVSLIHEFVISGSRPKVDISAAIRSVDAITEAQMEHLLSSRGLAGVHSVYREKVHVGAVPETSTKILRAASPSAERGDLASPKGSTKRTNRHGRTHSRASIVFNTPLADENMNCKTGTRSAVQQEVELLGVRKATGAELQRRLVSIYQDFRVKLRLKQHDEAARRRESVAHAREDGDDEAPVPTTSQQNAAFPASREAAPNKAAASVHSVDSTRYDAGEEGLLLPFPLFSRTLDDEHYRCAPGTTGAGWSGPSGVAMASLAAPLKPTSRLPPPSTRVRQNLQTGGMPDQGKVGMGPPVRMIRALRRVGRTSETFGVQRDTSPVLAPRTAVRRGAWKGKR